jgi:hypothetical protein
MGRNTYDKYESTECLEEFHFHNKDIQYLCTVHICVEILQKKESLAKYIEMNIKRWFFRTPILNLFVLYSMRIAVIIDGEELKTAFTRIYKRLCSKIVRTFSDFIPLAYLF